MLAGMIILTILSLFFIAYGYFLGYLVIYSSNHVELKLGDPFLGVRQSFCFFSGAIILSQVLSPIKFIKQLNLNTLKTFPLSKPSIFAFDIFTGIFDFRYLFLAESLLSLIAGVGGFSISFAFSLILLLLSLSLLIFVHLIIELFQSLILFFKLLSKYKVILTIIFTVGIIALFYLNKLSWMKIVNNNPISWNINSIFSLTIFHQEHWTYQLLALNIFYSFCLLAMVLIVKVSHANLVLGHVIPKRPEIKARRIKFVKFISFFPDKIKFYIEKDVLYTFRSNRSLTAISMEIFLLCLFCYMHFIHSKLYDHVFMALGFVIIGPIMVWDFFLSNYWGFEKKGFGFYLYSNSDLRQAILSKNISFILVRFPVIIVVSLVLSILYSFKYLPVILLISFLLNIVLLMFSNFVAIENPYPVDLKEDMFSQKQQANFSLVGFIGLLTYIVLPAILLYIIYKLGTGLLFYSISISLLAIVVIMYLKLLSYSASLLMKQKGIIYKKLIKI